MAFTGNFMCTSFKKELMEAKHNFLNSGGNTFKIALYTNSASFTAATTAYTATNEVTGTGYTAAGNTLTRVDPTTSGTTALVFNDTASGDPSVIVLDFSSDKSSSAGDFTIAFPAADASNAIIRIA